MPVIQAGQVSVVATIEHAKGGDLTRVAVRTVTRTSAATIQAKPRLGGSGVFPLMPIPRGEMVFVLGVPAEGTLQIDNSHGDSPVEATVVGVAG